MGRCGGRWKRVCRPALRGRVVWTGFIGEQETVNAVYRSCDLLVIPSDYEPWAWS